MSKCKGIEPVSGDPPDDPAATTHDKPVAADEKPAIATVEATKPDVVGPVTPAPRSGDGGAPRSGGALRVSGIVVGSVGVVLAGAAVGYAGHARSGAARISR